MILFGVLVVALFLAVIFGVGRLRGERADTGPTRRRTPAGLVAVLTRAVAGGLITREQAEAIVALAQAPEPAAAVPERAPRVPLLVEGLGYLGGVLVGVGTVLLVSRQWAELELWAQLSLAALAAVGLTVAGFFARPETDPVLWRLRSFLWFVASGATAFVVALAAADALDLAPRGVALLTGSAVAVHGGLLWWHRDRPAQQLAMLVGVAVVAAVLASFAGFDAAIGLALWAVGVAWLVLGRARILRPPLVAVLLGALVAMVGATGTAAWPSVAPLFGLATAMGVVALGMTGGEPLLTGLGVAGTFVFVPWAVVRFFGGTLGAPVALLVTGLLLLGGLALLLTHGHHDGGRPALHL